jgi:serine/threonine protein kinase
MSMIGKILGHYAVSALLAKGGMGEVYRAKDQKLGRDVAIKVLPEEFAKDVERVARFQREAKLLASLNHPNIAAIHGLEESEGTHFLVLELIEGDTLADRIKGGPIPVEEALKLALQIAEALESAHEKGVIHRDLKPANIKVTPDGKVKVLDFGLAKAYAGVPTDVTLSYSPTISEVATQQGVILGTAAYMSPEQAKGKIVDKRADIWAFGVVLFEMLTGRQLFAADTVSETIAAVLTKKPDWEKIPGRVRPFFRKCLQKDPNRRLRDIGDAKLELEEIFADTSDVLVQPITPVEPRTKLPTILPWIAAVVILSVITGAIVWKLRTPEPHRVMRFEYELPQDQQFQLSDRVLAISPSGTQFVYSTSGGLCLRSMDEIDAKLIPGTEGAQNPFFSPDGKWVGYVSTSDNQLKKIATSGGASVKLANVGSIGSFSWGADDKIVYGRAGKGIMRISSSGGSPEEIVKAESEIIIHPQILPDGKSVLFTRLLPRPFEVMVQSLKSGESKELFEGDTARYLPTGHIVYAVGNNLFAVRFNPDRLEVEGEPIPIVEGILRLAAPQYDVSNSGTLVYIPGTETAAAPNQSTLVWVDRNGREEPLGAPPNNYGQPKISPNGTQVALTVGSLPGAGDIWIWDIVRKALSRLTFDTTFSGFPLWTPDGKRIAFASNREGTWKVYWKAADGTGKVEPLGSGSGRVFFLRPSSWSGDGKSLVLTGVTGTLSSDIGALSMEDDHKWRALLKEDYIEIEPQISPNGRWMAYDSNESGQQEVYVRPFPKVNDGKWPVSTNGGYSALWSRDGRELFYRSADSVMAVAVETKPTFKAGNPQFLFRGTYVATSDNGISWDLSPDGKRFLMMKELASTDKPTAAEAPRKINIALNWLEELKQKVPVR